MWRTRARWTTRTFATASAIASDKLFRCQRVAGLRASKAAARLEGGQPSRLSGARPTSHRRRSVPRSGCSTAAEPPVRLRLIPLGPLQPRRRADRPSGVLLVLPVERSSSLQAYRRYGTDKSRISVQLHVLRGSEYPRVLIGRWPQVFLHSAL